jgi:hypothetical protein
LLAGIVRCAGCGHAMRFYRHTSTGHTYYRCNDRANKGCAGMSVSAPKLDAFADDALAFYADGIGAVPVVSDASEQADALVEVCRRRLGNVYEDRANAESASEREVLDGVLADARRALAEAEADAREARRAEAGIDLPRDLSGDAYRNLPVEDRRHLLASLFGAIVIRPALEWREPVAQRAQIILSNEVPDGVGIIEFVAGQDGAPARTGVAAG